VCSLCTSLNDLRTSTLERLQLNQILKSLLLLQPSDDNKSGVFGVCLEKVPSVNIGEDFYCSVPK